MSIKSTPKVHSRYDVQAFLGHMQIQSKKLTEASAMRKIDDVKSERTAMKEEIATLEKEAEKLKGDDLVENNVEIEEVDTEIALLDELRKENLDRVEHALKKLEATFRNNDSIGRQIDQTNRVIIA